MTGVGLGRCGTAWVLLVALVADASASLSVIGTRFIYPAGVSALTIRVGNVGTRPALVQAWLDRGDETADPSAVTVPFILSPPLLRMDPQETQALQLRHTGEPLPDDRESLFWVNLLEVPGREGYGRGSGRCWRRTTAVPITFPWCAWSWARVTSPCPSAASPCRLSPLPR